jgi:hypothetical protein
MLMKEDRPVELFGLACGAVANLMDEEGLTRADALKCLYAMLLEPHIPPVVREALTRLDATEDECELWKMLGQKSRTLRRLKNHKAMSSPWPKGLFD